MEVQRRTQTPLLRALPLRLGVLVLLAAVTACGGGGDGGTSSSGTGSTPQPGSSGNAPTVLVSLTISSASASVIAGGSEQFSASGIYNDQSSQDVTKLATWASSDPGKVSVSNAGVITAVAGGTANVTASYNGASGKVTVTVFQPNPSPVPPLSQSVTYQIDYAHTGRATFGGHGPSFPPSAHWSTTLAGTSISYPVIADQKVFVTTNAAPAGSTYGSALYALDEISGNVLWGPTPMPGSIASFSAVAYDHSTLFVVNFDGVLRSFDGATGRPGWATQLPGQSLVASPPRQ